MFFQYYNTVTILNIINLVTHTMTSAGLTRHRSSRHAVNELSTISLDLDKSYPFLRPDTTGWTDSSPNFIKTLDKHSKQNTITNFHRNLTHNNIPNCKGYLIQRLHT